MPSIKYFIKGNSQTSAIYLRFLHGRQFDFKKSTKLTINPKYWNNNKGQVRNIADFQEKFNVQNVLNNLRSDILGKFNGAYSEGTNINSAWLSNSIDNFFNQGNEGDLKYFIDYGNNFIKYIPNKVQKDGSRGVSDATIKKYRSTLVKVADFENHSRKRLKIDEIDLIFHADFTHYLNQVQNLNANTVGRYIGCIKSICRNARQNGIKVHPEIDHDAFRRTKEKSYFVTLSKAEIDKIFYKELSDTPYLENARDWLIIGVWTGTRVSDLLELTRDHVKNDFIEYSSKKTKQQIMLPIHWQVQSVMEKRKGNFPRKISSQKYNDYIKDVCRLSGIDALCKGGIFDPETKRKKLGFYPKWKLVSTHIARRSFATNHYSKIPTPIIMAATGHKTEKMLLVYIGKIPQDNAIQLREFWEKEKIKQDVR